MRILKKRFNINKVDDKKVFLMDIGMVFRPFGINEKLLDEFEIPIPICNGNFSLQGNLANIAEMLGGQINREIFDLVLKQLEIDDIIKEGTCTLPPPPTNCPSVMDISQMIPQAIENNLQCNLAENCYGISCCVNINFSIPMSSIEMNISFPVWFQLDPCDFRINTGIGPSQFEEQLLKYEWGKESTIELLSGDNAPIKIIYAIDNFGDGFITNLRLEICLPIDDTKYCILPDGFVLLEDEQIPACSLTAWTNLTDFSFEEWVISKGESIEEQLSNAGKDALLDLLGLNEFLLSPPCDRKRGPYSPSMSGWNNLCPNSFVNLPSKLPSYFSCSVPDYCTGINCCLEVKQIGLSINAFIDIDMCNYTISGGIETLTFNFSLFNYDWGKTETVSVKDIFRLRFSIKKPTNENVFIITMRLAVCLERDGRCIIDEKVLDGTKVPQPGCDMSIDISNFSAAVWFENNGLGNLSITDELWGDAITFLSEVVGLDKHFLDEQCDIQTDPYKNATMSWYNECQFLKADLPDLPDHSVCHIGTSCTSLACCINVNFLRRSLQASFEIDFCNYTIKGNLEKSNFKFDLIDFKWGYEAKEKVLDLLQIRYKLDKTDKHFIFDLSVEVCMDSRTSCQPSIDIYKKAMIPIPVCNLDAGFTIGSFSLNEWLNNVGSSIDDNLPTAVVALLLSQLNIDKFQQETPCSSSDVMFMNTSNGWNSECNASFTLPSLPDEMVCYMGDTCTSIECCVSVDILRTSIHVKFLLDTCRYKLTMGIERLETEVILLDYQWGKTGHFTLGGVFQIEYRIDDLQSQKKFIVNAKLKICFEQEYCLYEIDILSDAYIPKPLCDWNVRITAPGFSLDDWISQEGYDFESGSLKEYMIEKLFDTLGLSKYLDENECNREMHPFTNGSNGWTTDCPRTLDTIGLPDVISCHIPTYCTGFDCCVYMDIVKRSFKLYLHIDTCNNMFSIGIEKFGLNVSLLEYEWGKAEQFSLFGALRISYSVLNLATEHQYVINLDMSLCIKESTCETTFSLLKDARIPKIGCERKESLSDFKMDQYLDSIGVRLGDIENTLSGIVADKLLETLGVSMYILEEQCEHTVSNEQYITNECDALDIDLKTPDIMTCIIPTHCTGITCCINIPLIGRSISVTVDLDACTYQLSITIEKLKLDIRLFEYEWGTWQQFDIKDVFRLKYRIDDLESSKQFVISVRFLACFDSETCSVDESIVDNLLLPKPLCNFEGSFNIPDFSLQKWIDDNGNKQTDSLSDILRSILFEQLGLTPYLLQDECDVGVDPGWTKDCPLNASLPSLPSNIKCAIGERCSGFTCCVNVPLLQRSFSFYFDLNTCNFLLSARIEKLVYNQSLVNYEFGHKKTVDLFGVVKLSYTIFDDNTLSVFKLSAEVSICLDSNSPCSPVIALMDKIQFPKPLCNWDMPFKVPGFDIDNWLQEHGITEQALRDTFLAQLIDTLGLSHYFKDNECSQQETPYKYSVNGWNTDCPLAMMLPQLPDELRCYVPDYCTAVECCLDVGLLKRGFSVILSIDACSNRLVVGIEDLQLNVSLNDYNWGSTEVITLLGIIQITYKIENYEKSRQYVVDAGLKVCLSHDNCEFQTTLLENTTFAKPLCRWDSDFLIPDFSLDAWLDENNVIDITHLQTNVIDKLLKEIGLNQYLQLEQCDRATQPFSKLARFQSECREEIQLPDLPETISCYLSERCTSIRCCVDVDVIQRSFDITLNLDTCNYILEAQIENMKLDVPLVDYKFGEESKVYLFGVIRLLFKIEKVDETAFIIDATIDVCFEASGACIFSSKILNNARIPNVFCSHGFGFQIPGFSLDVWLKNNGIRAGETIGGALLSNLFSAYGIDNYLQSDQCVLQDSRFDDKQGHYENI
ncbi:uncharacterized protein LOC132750445 [Ruditapes philippinarum]|uniref:uncharacterized protein LOC132750445 n=1 Tax=Ruditapes philippinarum TaxID=129788 RepID=UPI00295BE593|nr:uncharacterized protein LOC132750445 [Ruditapes philippinarum]